MITSLSALAIGTYTYIYIFTHVERKRISRGQTMTNASWHLRYLQNKTNGCMTLTVIDP